MQPLIALQAVKLIGSCVEYNPAEVRKTTARIVIIGQNTNLFALKEAACSLVGLKQDESQVQRCET